MPYVKRGASRALGASKASGNEDGIPKREAGPRVGHVGEEYRSPVGSID